MAEQKQDLEITKLWKLESVAKIFILVVKVKRRYGRCRDMI